MAVQEVTGKHRPVVEEATAQVTDVAAEVESVYATDNFRMYKFKVLPCEKGDTPHDWSQCPFFHEGETGRRRDPVQYEYAAVACSEFRKQGQCARGDACPCAHNVFEFWLHPTRYRTQMCKQGSACTRHVCFFAHEESELRTPSATPASERGPKVEAPALATPFANPQLQPEPLSLNKRARSSDLHAGATPKRSYPTGGPAHGSSDSVGPEAGRAWDAQLGCMAASQGLAMRAAFATSSLDEQNGVINMLSTLLNDAVKVRDAHLEQQQRATAPTPGWSSSFRASTVVARYAAARQLLLEKQQAEQHTQQAQHDAAAAHAGAALYPELGNSACSQPARAARSRSAVLPEHTMRPAFSVEPFDDLVLRSSLRPQDVGPATTVGLCVCLQHLAGVLSAANGITQLMTPDTFSVV
ncbi:hypothetical protein WJX72_001726 [[Myrmecia] bisecta]|uniref:C3H1-type domain-containing protein n=1 Tax=[Myrmecia] bisecta TaxID=41462 RepID=A0AAW1PAM2_9CHLO